MDDNRQALFEPKPAVEARYGPTLITMEMHDQSNGNT